MTKLELIERIHELEVALAREQHAQAAASLLRGRSHELGNQVQILRLASIELERRATVEQGELIADMRAAAEVATTVLGDLMAAARPTERATIGPAVTPMVRAAIEHVRPVIAPAIDLRSELADDVTTRASADELECIVFAALLDAEAASTVTVALRERQICGRRWIELLRFDDRGALEPEPGRFVRFLEAAVRPGGGEASLSPGRTGLELAIAFPVAQSSSSS